MTILSDRAELPSSFRRGGASCTLSQWNLRIGDTSEVGGRHRCGGCRLRRLPGPSNRVLGRSGSGQPTWRPFKHGTGRDPGRAGPDSSRKSGATGDEARTARCEARAVTGHGATSRATRRAGDFSSGTSRLPHHLRSLGGGRHCPGVGRLACRAGTVANE